MKPVTGTEGGGPGRISAWGVHRVAGGDLLADAIEDFGGFGGAVSLCTSQT